MEKKLLLSLALYSCALIAGGDRPQRSGSASDDGRGRAMVIATAVQTDDNGDNTVFSPNGGERCEIPTPGCLTAFAGMFTAALESADEWTAGLPSWEQIQEGLGNARQSAAHILTAGVTTITTGEAPAINDDDNDDDGATITS